MKSTKMKENNEYVERLMTNFNALEWLLDGGILHQPPPQCI